MSQSPPSSELYQSVVDLIAQETGQYAAVATSDRETGGCINQAEVVTLADGRKYFVKSNPAAPELFPAESIGLAALRRTKTISVPHALGSGVTESGTGFLILECIESGTRGKSFFDDFGRLLAEMHLTGTADQFGFESDNHIGQTKQQNQWCDNWTDFWSIHRIDFQLGVAAKNGLATKDLVDGCQRVNRCLERLVGSNTKIPSLIHGDLWSGNFMISLQGQPVLVDPAVYYGSREAEFGITTLFGGFDSRFYDAYNERWQMDDGWQDRVEIYKLYHLLNHVNLFGPDYLSGCFEIIKKFG